MGHGLCLLMLSFLFLSSDARLQIDVDMMSVLSQSIKNKKSTSFHVISVSFFDVILKGKKSASFRRTLFDIISMGESSVSFRCTSFEVISMGKHRHHFDILFPT